MYDFTFLAPCPVSGLMIQGTQDLIVDKDAVTQLAERLSQQGNIEVTERRIEGADHFFTNRLDLVMGEVKTYVTTIRGQNASSAPVLSLA